MSSWILPLGDAGGVLKSKYIPANPQWIRRVETKIWSRPVWFFQTRGYLRDLGAAIDSVVSGPTDRLVLTQSKWVETMARLESVSRAVLNLNSRHQDTYILSGESPREDPDWQRIGKNLLKLVDDMNRLRLWNEQETAEEIVISLDVGVRVQKMLEASLEALADQDAREKWFLDRLDT